MITLFYVYISHAISVANQEQGRSIPNLTNLSLCSLIKQIIQMDILIQSFEFSCIVREEIYRRPYLEAGDPP
jgi:hypothetical protein